MARWRSRIRVAVVLAAIATSPLSACVEAPLDASAGDDRGDAPAGEGGARFKVPPVIYEDPPAPSCTALPAPLTYESWAQTRPPLYGAGRAVTVVTNHATSPGRVWLVGVELDATPAPRVAFVMDTPASAWGELVQSFEVVAPPTTTGTFTVRIAGKVTGPPPRIGPGGGEGLEYFVARAQAMWSGFAEDVTPACVSAP